MRFRRKGSSTPEEEEHQAGQTSEDETTAAEGPFDISEVDEEALDCVDLGSLLVSPVGPMELRLQVDEGTQQVIAAVLVAEEGALELRAFAASRGGEAWEELRPRIAEETARLGGTATDQEGSFGAELLCDVPVQGPDGEHAHQVSRIVGCLGPNWLLRATVMGQPAVDAEVAGRWEETIRQTVVRRGREAMAPGSPLPLTLPPEARRVE